MIVASNRSPHLPQHKHNLIQDSFLWDAAFVALSQRDKTQFVVLGFWSVPEGQSQIPPLFGHLPPIQYQTAIPPQRPLNHRQNQSNRLR